MDGEPIMPSVRILDRAFSAGEITPELFGRIDLNKRQEGLALARNFITLPHGPAVNRPGTEFVSTVKNAAVVTRLIPFSYSNTQTFAIELGAGYFRWHTQASTLLYTTPAAWASTTAYNVGDMVSQGGVNYYCTAGNTNQTPPNSTYWYAMPSGPNVYEIPNPYTAAEVMNVHFVQSADVLTLVHPNHPPLELRRYGATNWQLSQPSFTPPANPLTGVTATATTGSGSTSYSYVVTAVSTVGLVETVASASATCTNDLTTSPNKNTISWTDPSTAGTNVRYNVYKLANGLYGYIGQAGGTSFVDNNITPDLTKTPPIADATFCSGTGYYPAAVSYFQQRRVFAGTLNLPQNVWATRSGTESNMSYGIPVTDDSRISLRIAAREASAIQHIVPTTALLLLTPTCEFKMSASNSDVLTPSNVNVVPQSYIGANNVPPVVVNNIVLYAASRGGHIRELSYSWTASSYVSGDVSLFAPHLFDYNNIVDMAYCRGPIPTLWAVSSNGNLLGMTYVPEQQITAWHHHDTAAGGVFESICCITETPASSPSAEDMLYCVVRRTINGQTVRYVERMHTRLYGTLADAFFVDCGVMQTFGAPVSSVSGLTWLEGQTVNILADGAVQPPQVVTNGAVTLQAPASKIVVGLPITAQLQTLPVSGPIDPAYGQGRQKNVNKVWLRVYRSSGINVGPDFSNLVPYAQRTTENYGSPPNMVSDEVEVVLTPSWGASGQVCVQQTDPLPLDIASMTLEVALGA